VGRLVQLASGDADMIDGRGRGDRLGAEQRQAPCVAGTHLEVAAGARGVEQLGVTAPDAPNSGAEHQCSRLDSVGLSGRQRLTRVVK
jgi:hypothetical protein